MGFEVVGTWTDDMDNPKKEIPKALIFGGLLMALFYILPATGFNIASAPGYDSLAYNGTTAASSSLQFTTGMWRSGPIIEFSTLVPVMISGPNCAQN